MNNERILEIANNHTKKPDAHFERLAISRYAKIESLRQQLADEKLCHQETKEQLAECERERDEALMIHQLDTGTESAVAELQEQLASVTNERDEWKERFEGLIRKPPPSRFG